MLRYNHCVGHSSKVSNSAGRRAQDPCVPGQDDCPTFPLLALEQVHQLSVLAYKNCKDKKKDKMDKPEKGVKLDPSTVTVIGPTDNMDTTAFLQSRLLLNALIGPEAVNSCSSRTICLPISPSLKLSASIGALSPFLTKTCILTCWMGVPPSPQPSKGASPRVVQSCQKAITFPSRSNLKQKPIHQKQICQPALWPIQSSHGVYYSGKGGQTCGSSSYSDLLSLQTNGSPP